MTIEGHVSHLVEAQKLEADAIVDLFRIDLYPSGSLFLKADDSKTWRGDTYQGWPLKFTGVASSSDEEAARPQFQLGNPEGIFSALLVEGQLDGAKVTRIRVLLSDLEANRDVYLQQTWEVFRIVSLTRVQVTLELRSIIDGPFFTIPARMFIPPEFPQVSLS